MIKPIGIKPERLWKEERWDNLGQAILRYEEAGHAVPGHWIDEYNRLTKELFEEEK